MDNKYVEWYLKNAKYFKASVIEEALNMPATTLQKFAKKDRPLPPQYHKPLENWIKKLIRELQ